MRLLILLLLMALPRALPAQDLPMTLYLVCRLTGPGQDAILRIDTQAGLYRWLGRMDGAPFLSALLDPARDVFPDLPPLPLRLGHDRSLQSTLCTPLNGQLLGDLVGFADKAGWHWQGDGQLSVYARRDHPLPDRTVQLLARAAASHRQSLRQSLRRTPP